MAAPIVECVPNFSEGRKPEVIDAIVTVFRSMPGCCLLDHRADDDHNRLVVSLAGDPEAVQEALLKAAGIAISKIDMESHQGAHPRIGAVDVIPFTPVRDMGMQACVDLAHRFGERYYRETGVPVYFYEEAARRPERKSLEAIRRGEYELLKKEANRPERQPDLGGPGLHPTAGATVIGARKFLVAFNINLDTTDVTVAKKIAAAVRASSGGFCHVKGIGLKLEERGMVQVSLNIVDHAKNPLYRVLETVRMEAGRYGVAVLETEIYGMVPAAALVSSLAYYLQLADFNTEQMIEMQLLEMMGGDK